MQQNLARCALLVKGLVLVALACVVTSMAAVVLAQTGATASPSSIPTVDELLALEPRERRATLKALDPSERRGLWFAVKKAQQELKGVPRKSAIKYRDMEGFPVDAGGWPNPNKARTKAALGTIVYDSGFPNIGFGGGQIVGNRFNTHTGLPVCNPGTVSTISALVVPGQLLTTSSVGFVLLGPQTGGGAAMALFSTFGTAIGIIDSVTFAGLGVTYTGSEFFVLFGDFASSYVPVLGSGTTLGQGAHGLVGYTGGMFPNIVSTFNLGGFRNSFIRATGIIVPVELMTFEVD